MKSFRTLLIAAAGLALAAISAQAAGLIDPAAVGQAVASLLGSPEVTMGLAGAGAAGITRYVQDGDTLPLTPAAAVASGVGYLFGSGLFGVATGDVAANTEGEFITEGVVDIAKTSALAIAVGDRVFWDAGNSCVNKTTTAQVCVGVAVAAAANPSSTVRIKLGAFLPAAT